MLFFLIALASALPNGAPGCAINEAAIESGMGSMTAQLGYTLIATKLNATSYTFTVSNPKTDNLQGVLIYVTSPNVKATHLGTITFADQTKYKYQSKALCASASITDSGMSTVTHSNPARVLLKDVAFTWTGSASDVGAGGLTVNAVVAALDPGQSGVPRWQHLADVPLMMTGATSTGAGGNVTAPAQSDGTKASISMFMLAAMALLA